jgi:peptidyl-prolyl cis-trans isomerase A (cyclophilin A)
MTRPPLLALALSVCLGATAARAESPAAPTPSTHSSAAGKKDAAAPKAQGSNELYAVFQTSRGSIGVKLLPAEAPRTVSNFVDLATGKKDYRDPISGEMRKGAYFDGTLFHRVIPGFMIQGGDPATKDAGLGSSSRNGIPYGVSGPGYKFDDELPAAGTVLFDRPCVLAMANAGPNTNGSQFFITEGFGGQVPQLEPRACDSRSGVCGYTRFGQGICGCELVSQIARGGNAQTKLTKVTITGEKPTCK